MCMSSQVAVKTSLTAHPRLVDAYSNPVFLAGQIPGRAESSPSITESNLGHFLQTDDVTKPLLSPQKLHRSLPW